MESEAGIAAETWLAIVTIIVGAIGSSIKMFFDWRAKRDAAKQAHELKLAKLEAEAAQKRAETALQASIVGIERHKKTMTEEDAKLLAKAIQEAAIEENVEDHLQLNVNEITKRKGTKFYSPEAINEALDKEEPKSL